MNLVFVVLGDICFGYRGEFSEWIGFQNGMDLHWFCGKTTFINIYLLNGMDALKLLLFSRCDFTFWTLHGCLCVVG